MKITQKTNFVKDSQTVLRTRNVHVPEELDSLDLLVKEVLIFISACYCSGISKEVCRQVNKQVTGK